MLLQQCQTNVPELLQLQELNRRYAGPREVLDYETASLEHLIGSLVSFSADTLFPQNGMASRLGMSDRIDRFHDGVARVGLCTTRYNQRCGKFMICLQLGDFWNLEFPQETSEHNIVRDAKNIIAAAAVKMGPIAVPVLAIRRFMVEE